MKKLFVIVTALFLSTFIDASDKQDPVREESPQATAQWDPADLNKDTALSKRQEKIGTIIEAINDLNVGEVQKRVEVLCKGTLDRQSKIAVLEKLQNVAADQIPSTASHAHKAYQHTRAYVLLRGTVAILSLLWGFFQLSTGIQLRGEVGKAQMKNKNNSEIRSMYKIPRDATNKQWDDFCRKRGFEKQVEGASLLAIVCGYIYYSERNSPHKRAQAIEAFITNKLKDFSNPQTALQYDNEQISDEDKQEDTNDEE